MDIESALRHGRASLSRRALLSGGLALTLAGCNSSSLLAPGAEVAPPPAPPTPGAGGRTVGDKVGTGPVRVGMVLPLTQNGAQGPVGVSMRNAAQLAIDSPGRSLAEVADKLGMFATEEGTGLCSR